MSINEKSALKELLKMVNYNPNAYEMDLNGASRKRSNDSASVISKGLTIKNIEPLDVDYFLDGIQKTKILSYSSGRPITLTYQAAGAIDKQGLMAEKLEETKIILSKLDLHLLKGKFNQEVTVLEEVLPEKIYEEVQIRNSYERNALENDLAKKIEVSKKILLDGSLKNRNYNINHFGIIKTTKTIYLPEEEELNSLEEGKISSIFKITDQNSEVERYSTYLRLNSNDSQSWDYGLVRLESFSYEMIPALASLAYRSKQVGRFEDGRGDRHLLGIRRCEELLRHNLPNLFKIIS